MTCATTANDPRVTGTDTVVLNVEAWDPTYNNASAWLDYTLEGPEGTWTGHGYGFYDWQGILHAMVMLTGSGAYDGLTYAVLGTVPSNSMTADLVGFIGPGAPPPGFPVMPLAEPSQSPQ